MSFAGGPSSVSSVFALLRVHCLLGTFDESQLSAVTHTCELNICS